MMDVCWLCSSDTASRTVKLRSKKDAVINHCAKCQFDFFPHENKSLLSANQLDKTRLESAGLDIPTLEKDFNNGYNQSKGYIQEYISPSDAGHNILEIGCSWGYFLKALKESGCIPYGVEINPVRANYVSSNLNIPCFDSIESVLAKNLKFKKIFSFYCLEYIQEPINYFKQLLSMLEPNGEIIFITPNLQDVLKDIWANESYQNFFYDECAIAYYSLKAVKTLSTTLKNIDPRININVKTKQGYSLYNHIHWYFNQKPINNNTLVGGDQLTDRLNSAIDKSSELAEKIANLVSDFNARYRELIESNGYGNQIIIRITT